MIAVRDSTIHSRETSDALHRIPAVPYFQFRAEARARYGMRRSLAHYGTRRSLAHDGIRRSLAHDGIRRSGPG